VKLSPVWDQVICVLSIYWSSLREAVKKSVNYKSAHLEVRLCIEDFLCDICSV
jgi:hypothetical protein